MRTKNNAVVVIGKAGFVKFWFCMFFLVLKSEIVTFKRHFRLRIQWILIFFCDNGLENQIFSILDNYFKPEIMKKVLQIFVLTLVVFGVKAQDPHFSQFTMAPMYLNPAMVGAFDGNYRLSGLFRSQWGSVLENESVPMYRTYTASAEFRTNKGFADVYKRQIIPPKVSKISSWCIKLISQSTWVNSGWRSPRKSSSLKHLTIW